MNFGKVEIDRLKNIMISHRDAMLESNIIGADFSFGNFGGKTIIFKIEPMVYYSFLTPLENASLSIIFPMNDYLTSGTMPELAMIDFEKPSDVADEYWKYVDFLILGLSDAGVRIASGHTGRYRNIKSGVAGSIALIGFREPVFSYTKIGNHDAFYVVGKIGTEMMFFEERMKHKRSRIGLKELSIEKYVNSLLPYGGKVHYIHDLAEGGLIRGLEEISYLIGGGFDVSYNSVIKLIADGIPGGKSVKLSSSSSGSIVVALDQNFKEEFEDIARRKEWDYAEIRRSGNGVRIDGRRVRSRDLFSNVVG
ncbi:MAG: hypothetical protein QW078_02105 [Thermoplasmatales archaeon]